MSSRDHARRGLEPDALELDVERGPAPGKVTLLDRYANADPTLIPRIPGKQSRAEQLPPISAAYAASLYGGGGANPMPASAPDRGPPRQATAAASRDDFEIQGWTAGQSPPPLRVGSGSESMTIGVQATGIAAEAQVRARTENAQRYSVGFVQTLHSSRRVAIYESEPGVVANRWIATRGAMLDQRTDIRSPAPWYNYGLRLGSDVRRPAMSDHPSIVVPQYSPEYALLAGMEGRESFTTYLVAMVGNDSSTIIYLGNVRWSIDWSGRFARNYTHFTGGDASVGAPRRSDAGGAVLTGPAANDGPPGQFVGGGGSRRRPEGGGDHATFAGPMRDFAAHYGGDAMDSVYGGDPEQLAALRANISPLWMPVVGLVATDTAAPAPTAVVAFQQATYRLLLERQPGFEAMVAYLAADPDLAAWKRAADGAAAAVESDRAPHFQLALALGQVAVGMLERDVHSSILAAYVRLSVPGRRHVRDLPIVTSLADGPIKQLLRGESSLVPLPAPDARPDTQASTDAAASTPDPALDESFRTLRERILNEDPQDQRQEARTRREALSRDLREADGRVLDRLRADTEVSLRIAALTQHAYPTHDSTVQPYSLELANDADSVTQLYRRLIGLDQTAQFNAIKTYLEQRPGPENQAARARVLQHQQLTNTITRLTDEQQREISRLIATGTSARGPLDILQDAAAGQGSAEEALRAAIELSRQPTFPSLRSDGLFRQTIESGLNVQVATVAGLTLSVHDFVLRLWGQSPNSTEDAESALPQDAVNPTQDPPPTPEELARINALFPPVVDALAAEFSSWLYVDDDVIRTTLTNFETDCARPEHRRIFERARMHPGVELTRRCNADSRIGDIRSKLHSGCDEATRQVAERVLGMRVDAATVGRIDGVVQLADQPPPLASGTIPLAQALRSTQVDASASWASGRMTVSQFVHDAAVAMMEKLTEWHLWGGCAGSDITQIWNTYAGAFRARPIGASGDDASAARTLRAELERITGIARLHPIELLVNAYREVPGGGDLAGAINTRVNEDERAETLRTLGLDAASVAERNRVPQPPPPGQFERDANDLNGALLAAQQVPRARSRAEEILRAAGTVWKRVRRLDAARTDQTAPAGTGATEADSFRGTYRRLYGIEPDRHVVEVARAAARALAASEGTEPSERRIELNVEAVAVWMGITSAQIRSAVRARGAELPESTASGFTRAQAEESARRIWAGIRAGNVVPIRQELAGRRDEERDLINRCFLELSGDIDIQFYVQQGLAASRAPGRTLMVGEGVRDEGNPGTHTTIRTPPRDASSWEEALDVARTGTVGILTRVRTALANDDRNEIFRVADDATPDERRTILGDDATMGLLRAQLRAVDFDRVYAVLTGTAGMAVRLYSRSEGAVSGSITRFFTDTDTEGMQRDIRDYARRRREAHLRRFEEQGRNPADPVTLQLVEQAVREDLLRTYDNPQVRAIIDREFPSWFSSTSAHQVDESGRDIEGRLLNGGEADGLAALRTDGYAWSSDILAQVRQLSPEQRALHRANPEFMRRVWDRSINQHHRRLILLALQSEEPAGQDHILAIVELGRTGAPTSVREQVARLSERELRRLRSEPDLVATICGFLNRDEQVRFRALLALDTDGAAQLVGATELQSTTDPATADGATADPAQAQPRLFSLASNGRTVPGQIDEAEVVRLGVLRAQCAQRLILGANNSWLRLLREAVEVFRADLRPRLRQLVAPSDPTAEPVDLEAAARDYEIRVLREQIWTEVESEVRERARDADFANGADVIRWAVIKQADPSDHILREDLSWFGNDHEDIEATIRAASPEHIIHHWSSVKRNKWPGPGGESLQFIYDQYRGARDAARGENPSPEAVAAMQRYQRLFARYVIEPSYHFEGILLPHTGGLFADRERTTRARQQLDRDNPNYARYRQALQERIRALDPGAVAQAIGATGADAELVGSRLRAALTDFNVAEELYAHHRGDGPGWFAHDEGRQLDRSFGDYRAEIARAEDQAAETGDISDRERRQLQRLDESMRERATEYQAAREQAASIAASVVGTVIAVIATALTAGAATPLAMAMYGALTAAAAASGEVLTREMVLGRTYDASGEGLREITTAAATGFVAAGAQYYAGRLTSGMLASASSQAQQGRVITEMAAQTPPRWQHILHAGGRQLVQGTITGLVETAGSALSPSIWAHGWDEGWIRAEQLGREQIRSRPLQIVRETIVAMIGASVTSHTTVGESVDPHERIGMGRTLRQIRSDLPGNVVGAVADAGIGVAAGEIRSLPEAAGHVASGVSSGIRTVGMGLHEGSVHRGQATQFAEQQLRDNSHLFVTDHERALYEAAVRNSFAQGDPPSAVEFSAARDALAMSEARRSPEFATMTPEERIAFLRWVREAPTTEEFHVRMRRNPRAALGETRADAPRTTPPLSLVEAAHTELRQIHDRSIASEDTTAADAQARLAQAQADIVRADRLEAQARRAAADARQQVRAAESSGAPNLEALRSDAARAEALLQEVLTTATLVRLSAQAVLRNARDAGHATSLETLRPGDPPPPDATEEQQRIILEANRRFRELSNPRDARFVGPDTPRLAWAEYLRQHGIIVPGAEVHVDTAQDMTGDSGGRVREQTHHPLDRGRARVDEGIVASHDSVIEADTPRTSEGQADGSAPASSVAREFRDGARAPNLAGVTHAQVRSALAALVHAGAIPNVQPDSAGNVVRVRVGEGEGARTITIEVLPPADTQGAVARSDYRDGADRVRVWISDRILDDHVPRALGGIISDVIARASGRSGADASAAGRHGQLRAMFAHLQTLENAPTADASAESPAAASVAQGRAESVARVRAEIDLVLLDFGILRAGAAQREAALAGIQDPELRRLIEQHVRGHSIGFDAAAVGRRELAAPAPTAADEAARSGQIPESAVLPPPPQDPIRPFDASDYPRIVELRMRLEAIREMDQRLAARDRSGAARDAALGESLRRREHVARVRELLAELQIGGTDQEFIRQRLAELNNVFPGSDDISSAVQTRVQRRLSAVSAHQRAEAYRQARAEAAQRIAAQIKSGNPFVTERVIVGGGMAGTSRAAALGTNVGPEGFVSPHELVVLGGDDMVSTWAPDQHWGQRAGVYENSDHPMFRGATEGTRLGDVVEDAGEFMHMGELNDAMELARQRLGLVPVPARVLSVEVARAGEATWEGTNVATADHPVRLTVSIDGEQVTVYARHTDITTGLGNPAMPNEGILDPASREALLARGPNGIPIVMGGEQMMARDARIGGRVLVVAFGPTGAWAALRAAQLGATHVDWAGTANVEANARALAATAGIDRTQETFREGEAQARIHRTTDQIISIEHEGGGAIVTYAYPGQNPGEAPRTYRVRYDHVLMTQGFESAGAGPSAPTPWGDNRVGTMIGDMRMRPMEGTDAPNLENAGEHAGAVAVFGAAAWDNAGITTDRERAELARRRQLAARGLSADSPDARTLEAVGNAVDVPPREN